MSEKKDKPTIKSVIDLMSSASLPVNTPIEFRFGNSRVLCEAEFSSLGYYDHDKRIVITVPNNYIEELARKRVKEIFEKLVNEAFAKESSKA